MPAKHFIGFGTLADLVAALDRAAPVQADCVTDFSGQNKRLGLTYYKQVIVVSQPAPHGNVLYCRIIVDQYESMNQSPLFHPEQHLRRAETAWAVVHAWLVEQGLTLQRAVVATPRSLKLLEGHADCLHYDKESDTWLRAAPEIQ